MNVHDPKGAYSNPSPHAGGGRSMSRFSRAACTAVAVGALTLIGWALPNSASAAGIPANTGSGTVTITPTCIGSGPAYNVDASVSGVISSVAANNDPTTGFARVGVVLSNSVGTQLAGPVGTDDTGSATFTSFTYTPQTGATSEVFEVSGNRVGSGVDLFQLVNFPSCGPTTQTVHVKAASLDMLCPAGQAATGAHFVITQIAQTDAPVTISVSLSNGSTVTGTRVQNNTNESGYDATFASGLSVTDATAVVPSNWSGEFNLSHLVCTDVTPTSVPPSSSSTHPGGGHPSTPGTTTTSAGIGTATSTYNAPSSAQGQPVGETSDGNNGSSEGWFYVLLGVLGGVGVLMKRFGFRGRHSH